MFSLSFLHNDGFRDGSRSTGSPRYCILVCLVGGISIGGCGVDNRVADISIAHWGVSPNIGVTTNRRVSHVVYIGARGLVNLLLHLHLSQSFLARHSGCSQGCKSNYIGIYDFQISILLLEIFSQGNVEKIARRKC